MKKLLKKIIHPFFKIYYNWYQKKPRKYTYKNVYTIVQPSVFSPKNTISTKVFLDYITTLDLKDKTVLELGCGSGIISVFSASKGANVTASDINKIALKSLKEVSKNQGFNIDCIYSDLFEKILGNDCNYIFINPPQYPKKPKTVEEQAWFCGDNFEYFEKLFQQLIKNLSQNTLMILSEDCNLKEIKRIASKNGLELKSILTKKIITEKNFIYKIQFIKNPI